MHSKITWMLFVAVLSTVNSARAGGHGCPTLLQWSGGSCYSDCDCTLTGDRPRFTKSSTTVGKGVVQLEFGYTFLSDDVGGTHTRENSFPEGLLRYGILEDWLELQVGLNYRNFHQSVGGVITTTNGAEDMFVGIKIALTPQQCRLPETALIIQSTLPTGGPGLSANEMLPGVVFLYSWDLSNSVSVGGSTHGNRALDPLDGSTYFEFAQSAVLNLHVNDCTTGFFEWYTIIPSGSTSVGVQHFVNLGATHLVTNDLQFDFRIGGGLNESSEDLFVGVGAIRRF